jgi:hypothetical protein
MSENLNNCSVIEDIDLSLYKFGLIHKQNINNYLVTDRQKKFQKFKCYALTAILFVIIIWMFFHLKFYKNPNYPIFYYDLLKYFGGLPQYTYALCIFGLVMALRLVYLFNYSDQRLHKWLDIIKVLKGLESMDAIGLENADEYKLFIRRIKFYKFLIGISLKMTSIFSIILNISVTFLIFNTVQSLFFGILNAIFYWLWITYCFGVQLYSFLFYFMSCYYFKIRFKTLINKISRKSKLSVSKLTARIIREHNSICNDIEKYNEFWKSFNFTLTYTLIPINLIFLQQILFDDLILTQIITYILVLIPYMFSHVMLNLVSASVYINASKSHKFLFLFVFQFQTKFFSAINFKQRIKV